MARGWKCPRCSTQNGEGTMNCANCGLIRGGVVVPTSYAPPEATASPPPLSTAQPAPLPAAAQGVGAPLKLEPGDAQPAAGSALPAPVGQASARPLWRRIPIRLAIFGAIVVAAAVGSWITSVSRSPTGDITRGGDLVSNDLRVGDCWDTKDPSADTIDNVTARPCGESHEYEVFYIGSLPAGDYPAEDTFSTYVENTCMPAFGTYVGRDYADSDLDITWLYPDSDGWAAGDRTVECSVYNPKDSRLTASVKGSGQ